MHSYADIDIFCGIVIVTVQCVFECWRAAFLWWTCWKLKKKFSELKIYGKQTQNLQMQFCGNMETLEKLMETLA